MSGSEEGEGCRRLFLLVGFYIQLLMFSRVVIVLINIVVCDLVISLSRREVVVGGLALPPSLPHHSPTPSLCLGPHH